MSDFDDIFILFMKNGDEVLLKIRLQTPTKTILGAVLFMYLLTNLILFMTQHDVVLLIMDMESAKSNVNGPKKKVRLWLIFNKNMTRTAKNRFKNVKTQNGIELNLSFN